ncbi:uncharacterized protein LOC131857764 [Cryptomeria japonica]|uniref:uncharacterized protein LOC131857764 n=1 Tax=Cryptomeria japonica TaxID=3369 RepID=UPI0027D9DC4B|nr:uncharacterized protein LOC131857764 [Cryptomeria japonica]
MNKLEVAIVEVVNNRLSSQKSKKSQFSSWDGKMKGCWFSLKTPPFVGIGGEEALKQRALSAWIPQKEGWYKLNFDGASQGNPGASGVGCIIHSSNGVIEAKQDKVLVEDTNNVAEIQAAIEGLAICRELGLKKVKIEGDSPIIINALRIGNTPNWRLNSFLRISIDLLENFQAFTINHILEK